MTDREPTAEATRCPACGALIYPADTLPCRDIQDCAATMTLDRALSYVDPDRSDGETAPAAAAEPGNLIYCERCEENFVPKNRDYMCPRCRR
jgi:hypothetical protein